MYKSQSFNLIINSLIISISVLASLILYLKQNYIYEGYELMFLLPLFYGICHSFLIKEVQKRYGISIFLAIYIIVSFSRYTILPILIYYSGWYFGRSIYPPTSDDFQVAIILMLYELVCYSFAIYFGHKYIIKIEPQIQKKLNFKYNTFIYVSFILFSLLLIILRPTALKYISFLTVNNNYLALHEIDTITSVVILFLSLARYILYFVIVKYILLFFQNSYPLLSFLMVSGVTLLNSFIIFGTNRADFVFTFIVSLLILIYLYGKYALILNSFFVILLPIIIYQISTFRQTTTITKGSNVLVDITDYFQIYLGGIYNVAISLDLPSRTGQILYLLADLFRSAIGPNMLLKNVDMITSSQLFNYRIYLNSHSSQILPMIGQGELYLGFLLSPLLGIIFILIAIYLTKVIAKSNRFEMIFILMLTSGRFGFVMAQNGNILINELTFTIPIFLVLYFFNNRVVIKNEKN